MIRENIAFAKIKHILLKTFIFIGHNAASIIAETLLLKLLLTESAASDGISGHSASV
jgi:phage gp29-like protein